MAVKLSGWVLAEVRPMWLSQQDYIDLCYSAVTANGHVIGCVRRNAVGPHYVDMCLIAARSHGNSLQYIHPDSVGEQYPHICNAAVTQTGTAFEWVRRQQLVLACYPNLLVQAVQTRPDVIQYLDRTLPNYIELCAAASNWKNWPYLDSETRGAIQALRIV